MVVSFKKYIFKKKTNCPQSANQSWHDPRSWSCHDMIYQLFDKKAGNYSLTLLYRHGMTNTMAVMP